MTRAEEFEAGREVSARHQGRSATVQETSGANELAEWLHTSRPTLQRQRSDGSGPLVVQLSARRIGYRKSAVERWLESRITDRGGASVSAKQTPTASAGARHGSAS